MKTEIKKFLDGNVFVRRAMIRCGFELETQATDGVNAESNDDEIDQEAADEAMSAMVSERLSGHRSLIRELSESLVEDIERELFETVSDGFDYSDYYIRPIGSISANIFGELARVLEVGTDNSVKGFEFRTKGPLKYSDFRFASKEVFNRWEHDIDEKCSFHVHVSLPGVKHYYGERMQQAMVEYIAENVNRLPETVRDRIRVHQDNQYISGLVSSRKKYSFINCHDQGSWEFRCFGNVQGTSEGITCLNVAIDALAYAYEAVKGNRRLLTDDYDYDVAELLSHCLTYQKSVSARIREIRKANPMPVSA